MGIKGEPQGKKRGFTPDEVRIIITDLEQKDDPQENVRFHTAIDSMLRSIDLLDLRTRDVMDLSSMTVKSRFYVIPRKTRKRQRQPQPIFLSSKTQQLLKWHIIETGKQADDYLFPGRWPEKPLSTRKYRNWVKDLARIAGIKDTTAYSGHSTRRTLFNHLQHDLHFDLRVLKEFLGHASIRSTEHYSISLEGYLEQIFNEHNLTS